MKISDFNNNCTLVAVQEVTRLSDEIIIEEFFKCGYEAHKGVRTFIYKKVLNNLGFHTVNIDDLHSKNYNLWKKGKAVTVERWYGIVEQFRKPRYTLRQFIQDNPEGTFIVYGGGHAWVVRDGISIDKNLKKSGLSRGITGGFQVLNVPELIKTGNLIFQSSPDNARRPMYKGKLNPAWVGYMKAYKAANFKPINPAMLPKEYTMSMLAVDIQRSNVIWEMKLKNS